MTNQINVERVGGRIKIPGPLSRGDVEKLKRGLPGARFVNPHWTLPLTLTNCHRLRKAFSDRLAIAPELNAWAREEIDRQSDLGELAKMHSAELSYVSDFIGAAMSTRTYQQVAAAFIADAGCCLVADQPGLGKTIELLAGVQEANPSAETRYHLIFAPSVAVSSVWPGEIEHWLDSEARAFPIRGTARERHSSLDAVLEDGFSDQLGIDIYVICNIEMARILPHKNAKGKNEWHVHNALYPELFAREWDTIVVDESHRALIKGRKPTQVRVGMTKLLSKRRVALSGTPMRGKPHQLWGTLNWLRPDLYRSYWDWVAQYWDVFSTRFSSFNLGDFLPDGEDRLGADLRGIMLRRTKAEVLPELPPKQYAGTYLIPSDTSSPLGVWLDMNPASARRYTQFVDEGTVDIDGHWLIANGALAERNRLIQLATSWGCVRDETFHPAFPCPKFDWLVQFIEEIGNERVVVSSHSTKLLNLFASELRRLNHDVHLLTGETKDSARTAMRKDFQSDDPSARIFLLNAKAGGVALTLDAADYLVMLDESTVPDEDEQVEDRIHRTSRMHQVTIYKLRMLDTIEEEIAWVAASADDVQRYILDGTRGIEYAKAIYQRVQSCEEQAQPGNKCYARQRYTDSRR